MFDFTDRIPRGVCRKCRSELVHNISNVEPNSHTFGKPVEEPTTSTHLTKALLPLSSDIVQTNTTVCTLDDCSDEDFQARSYNLRNGCSRPLVNLPSSTNTTKTTEDTNQENVHDICDTNSDSQSSLWLPSSQEIWLPSSQEIWLPSSQETGTTDTTDQQIEQELISCHYKRKALDSFLESCGLSPVKKQLRIDWEQSSERTKHDYLMKAHRIFGEVAKVLAPGQEHHLLDAAMKTSSLSSDKHLKFYQKHMIFLQIGALRDRFFQYL